MDDPCFEHGPPNDTAAGYLQYVAPHLGWQSEDGYAPERVPLTTEKVAEIGTAQSRCGFDQRVEHRLQIECRAADNLKHVTGRGLAFERLLEIAGTGAQFAEQPRVLHRDDRLLGKILLQRHLLLGERPDLLAIEPKRAEELAVFAEADGQSRSCPSEFCESAPGITGWSIVGCDVRHLYDRQDPGEFVHGASRRDVKRRSQIIRERWRDTSRCYRAKAFPVGGDKNSEGCFAQPKR